VLSRAGLPAADQDAIIVGLQASPRSAPGLSAREAALLDYAEALTVSPATIRSTHIDVLRAVGCDDRTVHDACAIVAYFAFVNRIADGLGVEVEG
jgi:alkylhydroperoxidase family enzyme